jgi:hypothetical protein
LSNGENGVRLLNMVWFILFDGLDKARRGDEMLRTRQGRFRRYGPVIPMTAKNNVEPRYMVPRNRPK